MYKRQHKCILPDVQEADLGSVWMCSDCGKLYDMVCPSTDPNYKGDWRVWSESFVERVLK